MASTTTQRVNGRTIYETYNDILSRRNDARDRIVAAQYGTPEMEQAAADFDRLDPLVGLYSALVEKAEKRAART